MDDGWTLSALVAEAAAVLRGYAAAVNGQTLKARLGSESVAPQAGAAAWLQVLGEHTCFYKNEELVP